MLSRFRRNGNKLKQPTFDLAPLQVSHIDRIHYLWKLSRFLQALRCHLDLELPKIVLPGGSRVKHVPLLECLTGVKLPPELEYEQRAPIEFRLINTIDGDWTCRVKMRREHKMQNNHQKEEIEEETTYGEIIKDPRKVEGLLREAQNYHLGPLHSSRNKMPPRASESGEKTRQRNIPFSKNVICVEIQSNSVVDLTLITLPNVNAIHSSRALQEFTLDYLATNCWILLLTQGIDRLQVHPAYYLAQQVDPLGHRTLGLFCCTSIFQNRSASAPEKLSNSASRPPRSTLGWKRRNSRRNQLSRWRVGRLDPFTSETRYDMTFNDLELKLFLENASCELFEKSMPKLLELITQINIVENLVPAEKGTDDTICSYVFRNTHAACVSGVKRLMTSMICGEKYDSEIESIYKLLGRRAFAALPLFIPLASQEDDISAFRQITEFSDMNLYADAYRLKEFEDTAIFSRRPRIYLREVRYHLKRMNPEAPEISFHSGQKTPLMELPMMMWKRFALDAMSLVIRLLQGAIQGIISKRCEEASSLQPYIMNTIFLKINRIFDNAKKSLSEALEFELVPYTESFQHFSKLRDCLLDDYHLTCHLLSQKTEKTRDAPKSFQKQKTKTKGWDLEINACADAGAYLNLALANFLDKTSRIIEKDLLEQIELCDLLETADLPSPDMTKSVVNDNIDVKITIRENSPREDATVQSREVAVQLARLIKSTMKDTEEELLLLDPFMKT